MKKFEITYIADYSAYDMATLIIEAENLEEATKEANRLMYEGDPEFYELEWDTIDAENYTYEVESVEEVVDEHV